MARRDAERTRRLRVAIRYLIERGELEKGNQSELARHFNVSRQRVHQIVVEERRRLGEAAHAGKDAGRHAISP